MPVKRKQNGKHSDATVQRLRGRPLVAREKLIVSAYKVMSSKGFADSTMAEIIEEAGVGVGSFYNYFSSKEDLARAVFMERAEEFGATMERVVVGSSNIAAATCYVFRRFIEQVEKDQVWASFIIQLEPSMPMFDTRLRRHARVGLAGAVADGRLKIDNIEAAITAMHAMMLAFAKAMLQGAFDPEETHRASLFILRMYGVAEPEALRLSMLSMESLRQELGQPPHEPEIAS